MEITLLIKSVIGLILILSFLLFLLFYAKKAKHKKVKKTIVSPTTIEVNNTLESLLAIIKNKETSSVELKAALDLVLKYHGHIHKKLGVRSHPDFDIYMDIIFTICRHPNTNKDIIVGFDRSLTKLNPEYMPDINNALTKGLNSRGL